MTVILYVPKDVSLLDLRLQSKWYPKPNDIRTPETIIGIYITELIDFTLKQSKTSKKTLKQSLPFFFFCLFCPSLLFMFVRESVFSKGNL